MTPDYKTRRDEAANSIMGPLPTGKMIDKKQISPEQESIMYNGFRGFQDGADWARADLMKSVDEILVKALEEKYFGSTLEGPRTLSFADQFQELRDALTAWQAIKETDNG